MTRTTPEGQAGNSTEPEPPPADGPREPSTGPYTADGAAATPDRASPPPPAEDGDGDGSRRKSAAEPADAEATGTGAGTPEETTATEPGEPSASTLQDPPPPLAGTTSGPERRRVTLTLPRVADPVLLVATVLVVVAAACAAYFGWSWYRAAHDESLAYSRDRDAVLRAGEQAVQNMNTLDYRKIDQGLASWEDSSTGDLHTELVQGRAQFTAQVQLAKTVTTAKILDGAVTELDDRAGKASMIIAVQVTVTPPTGTPATKQSRMRAQLTRTRDGWKLSALGQAPVGTTASG